MWLRIDKNLAKHPKTLKLARLLKVKRREALGLIIDLFSWAGDAADKYGKLAGLEKDDIASALDLTGKQGARTVDALVEVGYLDLDGDVYSVHDWYEYSGKWTENREKDRARKSGKKPGDSGVIP